MTYNRSLLTSFYTHQVMPEVAAAIKELLRRNEQVCIKIYKENKRTKNYKIKDKVTEVVAVISELLRRNKQVYKSKHKEEEIKIS